jgi:hypothetical protein
VSKPEIQIHNPGKANRAQPTKPKLYTRISGRNEFPASNSIPGGAILPGEAGDGNRGLIDGDGPIRTSQEQWQAQRAHPKAG